MPESIELLPTAVAATDYHPVSAPDALDTAGYAAVGDYGGAFYKKVNSEPANAGKLSITLAGGGKPIWYEMAEGVYMPQMFGATSGDITDALQSIIDKIGNHTSTVKRGSICIPPGDWTISREIASRRQSLSILGIGYPIVRWGGDADGVMFSFRDNTGGGIRDMILLGRKNNRPRAAIRMFVDSRTEDKYGTNEDIIIDNVRIGRWYAEAPNRERKTDALGAFGFSNGILIDGAFDGNNDSFKIYRSQIHDDLPPER